jgi:hypothetical protein
MSKRDADRSAFVKVEADLLIIMEDCRKLRLSTAIELLELALAEVRDQAREMRPR